MKAAILLAAFALAPLATANPELTLGQVCIGTQCTNGVVYVHVPANFTQCQPEAQSCDCSIGVWQESNGIPGLQRSWSPQGAPPDTRLTFPGSDAKFC